MPSHYLNQCWVIVNWTLRNKLQWNLSEIKIQNPCFTKIHLKLSSANWRPFCPGGGELTACWEEPCATGEIQPAAFKEHRNHCSDVITSTMVPQITCVSSVYATLASGADQRKYQSFASLAFVRGIHRWPMNSSHKGPVTLENVSIWWCHHVMVMASKTAEGLATVMIYYQSTACCACANLNSLPWRKWPPFCRQHFQMHFHEWKVCISILISLRFVPKGPIDNKSALVQVMAWHQKGDTPLSEPMQTKFTNAYMQH